MSDKIHRAAEIWALEPMRFNIEHDNPNDGADSLHITCTTSVAQNIGAILPPEWCIISPNPEFLGWTPQEIAEHLGGEFDPALKPQPDKIDGVLHEHLLFVLNRYRNDALFEAETMPNNRKHAVQGLTESAELTRRLIHIVEKMEVK